LQTPEFLEISDVLDIYNFLVNKFGGTLGVRDEGLLESAVESSVSGVSIQLVSPIIRGV
jgi:death-on-curing protein